MGRPPETPGSPLTERLGLKVSTKMLEYMDQARGKRSRSRYIRDLIRDDARKAGR